MTNELEKTFFDTFGIEPIEIPSREYDSDGEICSYYVEYPQITDSIYLNLILIMNPYAPPVGDTMEEMKSQILYWCIRLNKEIKHQVRTLFEEG